MFLEIWKYFLDLDLIICLMRGEDDLLDKGRSLINFLVIEIG